MNSGGPNYLGLRVPNERYDPVNVFQLRSKSVLPSNEDGERLVRAFVEEAGYQESSPLPCTAPDGAPGAVGYISSISVSEADRLRMQVTSYKLQVTSYKLQSPCWGRTG